MQEESDTRISLYSELYLPRGTKERHEISRNKVKIRVRGGGLPKVTEASIHLSI
jgi:hypothetical protein